MEKYEVIIIGAGASGLAASWSLCKEGFKVACFEQGDFLKKEKLVPIKKGGELQKYNFLVLELFLLVRQLLGFLTI